MGIVMLDMVDNCTVTAFFATIEFDIELTVPGEIGEEHWLFKL